MKYTVRLLQDWNCPYPYADGDETVCRSVEDMSWTCPTKELAAKALREFLDAPCSEMTEDKAREEFGSEKYPVPEENVENIVRYFNGKLGIFNQITADMENIDGEWSKKYEIPYELNHFEVMCDKPPANETQNSAYIEVTVEND